MDPLERLARERRAEHVNEDACERMEDDLRLLREMLDTSKVDVAYIETIKEFMIQAETNILAARLTLESAPPKKPSK